MSGIDDLTCLCPPPADPPTVDWPAVESALGRRLPTDYKRLATVYGPGGFCRFIHVHHPLSGLTEARVAALQQQLQRDRDRNWSNFPVPYDPRLLVVVGVTDNGDHLFWIADPESEPDSWHIAVQDRDGREWFTFEGTLTDFLVSVLGGETAVPQFPEDLLRGGTDFVPSEPRTQAPPPTLVPLRIDTNAVREWAWANGYEDLPPRGRVPAAIIDAWRWR
ncbi:Lsr2 family DNA-binding protein [Streptomyces sp. NPDC054940]